MTGSKSVTIGAHTYVLRHAPATVALRAAATMANGFAPLLDGWRRGKGGEFDRILAGVAETMADPALAANLEKLCALFAPYTDVIYPGDKSFPLARVDGAPGIFEQHFAGKLDDLVKWLQESVEFNLGGFLAEARTKLESAKGAAKDSPSPSPKDAGTSG